MSQEDEVMVQQLLRGSSELNRMRAEIKTFILTIFGLIDGNEALRIMKLYATQCLGLHGKIGVATLEYKPFDGGLEIRIFFNGIRHDPALKCSSKQFELSLENVQKVHTALPHFWH